MPNDEVKITHSIRIPVDIEKSIPLPVENKGDHSSLKVDTHVSNWSAGAMFVYAKEQPWDYLNVAANVAALSAAGKDNWEAVCLIGNEILCKRPK